MGQHKCPRCGSTKVKIGYPDLICLSCGHSEELIDFPINWEWHRHYSREYSRCDPGPCYSEELKPVQNEAEDEEPSKNFQLRLFQLEENNRKLIEDNRQLHLTLNHLYKQIASRATAVKIPRGFRGGKRNTESLGTVPL